MQTYHKLLLHILVNGEPHQDRTGVGTKSVFGYQWRHNMREGFPLLTTKRVSLRWVFEELRWFLSGSTDETLLRAQGVDIWKEWATAEQCAKFGREAGDLGPIYGKQWRDFDGSDQIGQLLDDLQRSPNSRRLIVSAWHPRESRQVSLPPCHTLYQVKVHDDNSLSLHLYARSIDAFLGLPYNIASYGLLLEMLAAVTKRESRDLVISFGDLHLYSNHNDQAHEQLSRTPRPLPSLKISLPDPQADPLANLLAIRYEHLDLQGYDPHPAISAEVAV